jgi:presenilin 1
MTLEIENPVEVLETYSFRILKIAIPVVLTLVIDALVTRFLEDTHGSVSLDRGFSETMSYSDQGVSTEWSIYLALIMIASIVVVTAIIVALYWFGCLKILFGWMIIAVTLILSFYVYVIFGEVPTLLNVPYDWFSFVIFVANIVTVGDMSIFWRAPLIVTQVILVFISVMIALVFLSLPDWTIWVLLVLLVIYDAVVVLCPGGLLNLLVKKSEERGDELPALVYSSAAWIHDEEEEGSGSSSSSSSSSSTGEGSAPPPPPPPPEEPPADVEKPAEERERGRGRGRGRARGRARPQGEDGERPRRAPRPPGEDGEKPPRAPRPPGEEGERPRRAPRPPGEEGERPRRKRPDGEEPKGERKKRDGKKKKKEREGVRLGLGDFCFYGILVTRAARLGWDLVILCVFAVILGLSLTLLCLAVFQRALPALPFSLVLGIIFFLTGAFTFREFHLSIRQTLVGF